MSEKTLMGLAATLVVLLLAWGVVALSSSMGGGSDAGGSAVADAFQELSRESVTRVVLTGPADTIALAREADGSWSVNGYDSDSTALARFWSVLDDVQVRELAAANPSNHGRLGVGADSAWAVEFSTDGGSTELLLGKRGAGFSTAYVRLPDSDEVYTVAGGDLRGAWTRTEDQWRDKVMAALDTARVERVEVDRDGERYTLVRGDEGWSVDGAEADDGAVSGLVGALARFEAQGFAPDGTELEGDERRRIVALDAGGDTLTVLEFARTEDSGYLGTVRSRPYVYEVPSWRLGRLAPERGDLEAGSDEESES